MLIPELVVWKRKLRLFFLIVFVGWEDRVGLGTDEWHQAHLAKTSQGGRGGRVQGFLQNLLQGGHLNAALCGATASTRAASWSTRLVSCYLIKPPVSHFNRTLKTLWPTSTSRPRGRWPSDRSCSYPRQRPAACLTSTAPRRTTTSRCFPKQCFFLFLSFL